MTGGGRGGMSLSLKHKRSNSLTQHASLEPTQSRITHWDYIFEPCSYIPTSLIPRLPSEPPRAIGAVILSRAVARFHPAANHFVSAQTELPDRRAPDRLCLPEKTELENESAFLWNLRVGAEKQPEHLHHGGGGGWGQEVCVFLGYN